MFILGWKKVYYLAKRIAEELGATDGRHNATYLSAAICIQFESISGDITIRDRYGDVVFQTSEWPNGRKAICFHHGLWEREMRRIAKRTLSRVS